MLAVFDTCELRQSEIAALTDDLAVEFIGVHSYRVIAAIADIRVAFRACLDIGADAAVPQQVYLHLQNRANKVQRPHACFGCAQKRARLGA